MVKALFADFCGTIVYEDDPAINIITERIYSTGKSNDKSEIGRYWWNDFQSLFLNSYGDNFCLQRELEHKSLVNTIKNFCSSEDAGELSNIMFDYWAKPPIFEESKEFFERCPVPIYLVSNIDNCDIQSAINLHLLKPAGVFTSENARSYKPRKEIFELALKTTGLKPEEVVYIGDSVTSDVNGAKAAGISAIWLNRFGKVNLHNLFEVRDLLKFLETEFFS